MSSPSRCSSSKPTYEVPPWVKPEWISVPQDASNTSVLVARRETYSRVGLFNTEFASGEDTEWLVRANEAGVRMTRLQEVLVHKRLHGANLSVVTLDARKAILARIARESVQRRRNLKTP
jgi:GT2 family glycosyltransferase